MENLLQHLILEKSVKCNKHFMKTTGIVLNYRNWISTDTCRQTVVNFTCNKLKQP